MLSLQRHVGKVGAAGEDSKDARELKVDAAVRHLKLLQDALELIHGRAASTRERRHDANRRAAERRGVAAHADFEVGDYYVLVARETPDKLGVRWGGPARITAVVDNWVFEVENLVTGRKLLDTRGC